MHTLRHVEGKDQCSSLDSGPSRGDPKEEGDITNSEVLHKEQAFEPHIRHLTPGDGQWEGDPLFSLENQRSLLSEELEGVRK